VRIFCRRKLPPVRAAKVVTDLRRYPVAMRSFAERLLLFLLSCLLCLRLLGHVALRDPQSWLSASRQSTCIHSDFTTIATLILRASEMVNDRHTVATCDRTRPSRDAWIQRAVPDQDAKKFSRGRTKSRRLRSRTIPWLIRRMGRSVKGSASEASF
jgi:hypothetical protein